MLGAIVGDIVGSIYEYNNIKTKDFPLFGEGCRFTDDTVMTIAVSEALLAGGTQKQYRDSLKKWAKQYPHAGYGHSFARWAFSHEKRPYGSWGNGSAMRVSACGWEFDDWTDAETAAIQSAAVTHDHEEGIAGAKATVNAIVLARRGASKSRIKEYIEKEYGYNLSRTLDEIRPTYKFDVSCAGTVPEAMIAFLESENFEDAIRNAISLGGDSDTLAAITGSIAEAAYGIPQEIADKALSYLDEPLLTAYSTWKEHIQKKLPGPVTVGLDLHFSNEQFERIKCGLKAQAMEDKWNIYFENDSLSFRRAWTGDEVYSATLEKSEKGYEIKSFIVNNVRPDKKNDFAFDKTSVTFLILHCMLGESADSGFDTSDPRSALAAWSWYGRQMFDADE